jgi:hypothetical protein
MMIVKLKITRERSLEGIRYLKLYFICNKSIQIVHQIHGWLYMGKASAPQLNHLLSVAVTL